MSGPMFNEELLRNPGTSRNASQNVSLTNSLLPSSFPSNSCPSNSFPSNFPALVNSLPNNDMVPPCHQPSFLILSLELCDKKIYGL